VYRSTITAHSHQIKTIVTPYHSPFLNDITSPCISLVLTRVAEWLVLGWYPLFGVVTRDKSRIQILTMALIFVVAGINRTYRKDPIRCLRVNVQAAEGSTLVGHYATRNSKCATSVMLNSRLRKMTRVELNRRLYLTI